MKNDLSPFEGKIVLICYTECDCEGEDSACLIYRVVGGQLETVYGVIHLPDGTCWHHHLFDQTDRALEIILGLRVTEVYIPHYAAQNLDFFGLTLGHQDISEELNERGEIDCWCEFGGFGFHSDILELLEEHQIRVREIDPTTMRVVNETG